MRIRQVVQSWGNKQHFFYGYIIIAAAFIILVVTWGTNYTYGVFFKPMIAEFGWTRAATSGAFSLSMVFHGFMGIILGFLNDKFGPRFVVAMGGLFAGVGFLLLSQVNALWHLYLLYAVMIGTGASVVVPLNSTVVRWFVSRRTFMTGIVAAGIGIGAVIGPPLANSLISTYGWRVSYMILGSIVFVVVIAASQFLKRDPSQIGQVAFGQNSTESIGQNPGIEGFTLRKAIHIRQFWMIFSLFLCFGFCLFAVMIHIVPYATDVGISAASAANVLAAIGAVSILSKVAMGFTGDLIGNKMVLIISFILMVLSLVWFSFTRDLWSFYLFAVIFGIAYGSHISQASPFTASMFGLIAHGSIYGTLSMGMWAGLALGPFVAGYIFDMTGSYRLAFFICIAVGIVGLILTVLVKSISNKMTNETAN